MTGPSAVSGGTTPRDALLKAAQKAVPWNYGTAAVDVVIAHVRAHIERWPYRSPSAPFDHGYNDALAAVLALLDDLSGGAGRHPVTTSDAPEGVAGRVASDARDQLAAEDSGTTVTSPVVLPQRMSQSEDGGS
jgi:hypothetical protein